MIERTERIYLKFICFGDLKRLYIFIYIMKCPSNLSITSVSETHVIWSLINYLIKSLYVLFYTKSCIKFKKKLVNFLPFIKFQILLKKSISFYKEIVLLLLLSYALLFYRIIMIFIILLSYFSTQILHS